MSKPNSGYIDPDLVIGIFRFSDFLFPVRQRRWVLFGVATLPHLPVMSLWKKLMDIQKPLAGVTRCASWHVDFQIFRWPFLEGRWGEHKKERPPPYPPYKAIWHFAKGNWISWSLVSEVGDVLPIFCTLVLVTIQFKIHFHCLFQASLPIKSTVRGWWRMMRLNMLFFCWRVGDRHITSFPLGRSKQFWEVGAVVLWFNRFCLQLHPAV